MIRTTRPTSVLAKIEADAVSVIPVPVVAEGVIVVVDVLVGR